MLAFRQLFLTVLLALLFVIWLSTSIRTPSVVPSLTQGASKEGPSHTQNGQNGTIPFLIITGMEHSGTTVLAELIKSAPDVYGPFETGFLLAPTPRDFRSIKPFFLWTRESDLNLTSRQQEGLLNQSSHIDMYKYAMKHSTLFQTAKSEQNYYVDKTPRYVYFLPEVMQRAPGVKIVVSTKPYEKIKVSWTQHHNETDEFFETHYKNFQAGLRKAQTNPTLKDLIYVVRHEDIWSDNEEQANRVASKLFEWIGLPWDPRYRTGEAYMQKGTAFCGRLCG